MKKICPNCKRTHYYKRWGMCCTKLCYENYVKQESQDFLSDIPPSTLIHQDGGLLVIGVKPTREQLLNEL